MTVYMTLVATILTILGCASIAAGSKKDQVGLIALGFCAVYFASGLFFVAGVHVP